MLNGADDLVSYLEKKLGVRTGQVTKDGLLNGHSFRIGAATTPAEHKVEDHLIQTLGRWVSQSYVRYCHTAHSIIKRDGI
jgi:hypothetical protein